MLSRPPGLCSIIRYILSESKTITRFILYFIKDLPLKWDSAPSLAVICACSPLFAISYPFMKLWSMIKPKDSVGVGTGPFRGQQHAQDASPAELWYAPLMFVQFSGGIMTEVASMYFAISTTQIASIVSAAFGLYQLAISILATVLKGSKKSTREGETFEERRSELAAGVDSLFEQGRGTCWRFLLVFLAGVCCVCVTPVPFYGVYLIVSGEGDTEEGAIFAGVGFLVFLIVCLVANSWTKENEAIFIGVGILVAGFGVVYFLTIGPTAWVISLLAVGSGFSILCCLAALGIFGSSE